MIKGKMTEVTDFFILIIAALGMDLIAVKSGTMGGIVSLMYERKKSARLAFVSISSGAFLAGYLGPLASDFLEVEGKAYAGICFIIGLLSMKLVPWIFEFAEKTVKDRMKPAENRKTDE